MAACVIQVEKLADGRFQARSTVFPEIEIVAATEDEARRAFEQAIEEILRQRLQEKTPDKKG